MERCQKNGDSSSQQYDPFHPGSDRGRPLEGGRAPSLLRGRDRLRGIVDETGDSVKRNWPESAS